MGTLVQRNGCAATSVVRSLDAGGNGVLGHFLHNLNTSAVTATLPLNPATKNLDLSLTHLRLIPFSFPHPMKYHFDGLAAILRFKIDSGAGTIAIDAKPYASEAEQHWEECIFTGSGTGPTVGVRPCLVNPVVNLLPINGQLWLTIDTAEWGRVDMDTLETVVGAKADVPTLVLNAHPACDRTTNECFVQHPCPKSSGGLMPITDQACFSKLQTTTNGTGNLKTVEYGRATLPESRTIQHSHSPCITPNYVVAKLDSFVKYWDSDSSDGGVLRQVHQMEDNEWLVMNRHTNKTSVMKSDFSFVNNHFWNCFESPDGGIVVDSVTATSDYLSTYFEDRLVNPTNYTKIFFRSMRCQIPASNPNATIECKPLLKDPTIYWDYPTFNPYFKMNPDYKYFYGISAKSPDSSKWFDRIMKVNVQTGEMENFWDSPGVYVTEADFVPLDDSAGQEDHGILLSVAYNQTAGRSILLVLNAETLSLIDSYPLGNNIIPFHAHGISCTPKQGCFTNP